MIRNIANIMGTAGLLTFGILGIVITTVGITPLAEILQSLGQTLFFGAVFIRLVHYIYEKITNHIKSLKSKHIKD